MTYIRNPHYPDLWESNGDYTGKFMAKDGTLHDSPEEALAHNKRVELRPPAKDEGKETGK